MKTNMNEIIRILEKDKTKLEKEIKNLLNVFEKKYEMDFIRGITTIRWNGSNNAFGPISGVLIKLTLE